MHYLVLGRLGCCMAGVSLVFVFFVLVFIEWKLKRACCFSSCACMRPLALSGKHEQSQAKEGLVSGEWCGRSAGS